MSDPRLWAAKGPSMPEDTQDGDWFGVDVEDLSARLRFKPDDAHIWLEDERMLLLHLGAFGRLRQELVEVLGYAAARGILERLGAASGALDAAIARRTMAHAGPMESFRAGPRLHAIEGMVVPEEISLEVDPDTGFHMGEWLWRHSAEAEAHLQSFGQSVEPVCWTLIGYASAYSSAFMGRPILYKEVECMAMGAPHCRIVGRPAALWEDSGPGGSHLAIDLSESAAPTKPLLGDISPDQTPSARAPQDIMAGASPAFALMMSSIRRFAATDVPVLITGEPGVGKKSAGRAIHKLSKRNTKRLSVVNCAAYDEDSLEAELFGRERTVADAARQGLVERNGGGTILLEDVQALPARCQAKLLRLIVDKEFVRRGEAQPRPANVRIVACGNSELREATRSGRFRQDLYFRLAVCPIHIPPLNERRGDVPVLIRHFLEIFVDRHRKTLAGMTMDAVSYLLTHEFPGNVAELESILERAVILAAEGEVIRRAHLQSSADLHAPNFLQVSRSGQLAPYPLDAEPGAVELERLLRGGVTIEQLQGELISKAVSQCNGNLSQAAKLLGLTRAQLAYRYRKIKGR